MNFCTQNVAKIIPIKYLINRFSVKPLSSRAVAYLLRRKQFPSFSVRLCNNFRRRNFFLCENFVKTTWLASSRLCCYFHEIFFKWYIIAPFFNNGKVNISSNQSCRKNFVKSIDLVVQHTVWIFQKFSLTLF